MNFTDLSEARLDFRRSLVSGVLYPPEQRLVIEPSLKPSYLVSAEIIGFISAALSDPDACGLIFWKAAGNGSYNHGQKSWDKFTLVALFQTRQTVTHKFIYTCSAPSPSLQCWTRVHDVSPEFQHCIEGWGEATHFKTDTDSASLKPRFKNTEN